MDSATLAQNDEGNSLGEANSRSGWSSGSGFNGHNYCKGGPDEKKRNRLVYASGTRTMKTSVCQFAGRRDICVFVWWCLMVELYFRLFFFLVKATAPSCRYQTHALDLPSFLGPDQSQDARHHRHVRGVTP